ncbi:hypothetical protein FRC19_007793 [Serendipita sp. 401]|nr:hypothetical protein FRC19_007793 [Serendipita sp. 401]KAG9051892.1 hypothetical protein FS842_010862 [Serendipita sp. 407]
MNASINDLADFSRGVLEEAEKRGSSSGLLARLTRRFQKAISLHSEIPSLGTARNVGELSNAEDIVAPTESSVAKEPETRASTKGLFINEIKLYPRQGPYRIEPVEPSMILAEITVMITETIEKPVYPQYFIRKSTEVGEPPRRCCVWKWISKSRSLESLDSIDHSHGYYTVDMVDNDCNNFIIALQMVVDSGLEKALKIELNGEIVREVVNREFGRGVHHIQHFDHNGNVDDLQLSEDHFMGRTTALYIETTARDE